MSRTKRQSTQNSKYFSGWLSPLDAFTSYKNIQFRYYNWGGSWLKEYRVSDEELWKRANLEYSRQLRDGRDGLTNTGVNTGFKKDAASLMRRENKKFCKKVLQDDWDSSPIPTRKSGKTYIYDWW